MCQTILGTTETALNQSRRNSYERWSQVKGLDLLFVWFDFYLFIFPNCKAQERLTAEGGRLGHPGPLGSGLSQPAPSDVPPAAPGARTPSDPRSPPTGHRVPPGSAPKPARTPVRGWGRGGGSWAVGGRQGSAPRRVAVRRTAAHEAVTAPPLR